MAWISATAARIALCAATPAAPATRADIESYAPQLIGRRAALIERAVRDAAQTVDALSAGDDAAVRERWDALLDRVRRLEADLDAFLERLTPHREAWARAEADLAGAAEIARLRAADAHVAELQAALRTLQEQGARARTDAATARRLVDVFRTGLAPIHVNRLEIDRLEAENRRLSQETGMQWLAHGRPAAERNRKRIEELRSLQNHLFGLFLMRLDEERAADPPATIDQAFDRYLKLRGAAEAEPPPDEAVGAATAALAEAYGTRQRIEARLRRLPRYAPLFAQRDAVRAALAEAHALEARRIYLEHYGRALICSLGANGRRT